MSRSGWLWLSSWRDGVHSWGRGLLLHKAHRARDVSGQSNDIYVVCLDDTTIVGRYTARTGPGHLVSDRNVLF